jgi:hypothetical protein
MNKIKQSEFNEKFSIVSSGPKTINSGKINVMFDKYEMLLKQNSNGELIETNIFASSIEAGIALVYEHFCEIE